MLVASGQQIAVLCACIATLTLYVEFGFAEVAVKRAGEVREMVIAAQAPHLRLDRDVYRRIESTETRDGKTEKFDTQYWVTKDGKYVRYDKTCVSSDDAQKMSTTSRKVIRPEGSVYMFSKSSGQPFVVTGTGTREGALYTFKVDPLFWSHFQVFYNFPQYFLKHDPDAGSRGYQVEEIVVDSESKVLRIATEHRPPETEDHYHCTAVLDGNHSFVVLNWKCDYSQSGFRQKVRYGYSYDFDKMGVFPSLVTVEADNFAPDSPDPSKRDGYIQAEHRTVELSHDPIPLSIFDVPTMGEPVDESWVWGRRLVVLIIGCACACIYVFLRRRGGRSST